MTAANNVFSNVREYDTDLDVFGNVFEWTVIELTPGSRGFTVKQASRVFTIDASVRVFVASVRASS